MYLRILILSSSFILAVPIATGIEVFLKNGDRLKGELLLESDKHLTISHPILGEIELAKSDLAEMPFLPPEPVEVEVAETSTTEEQPDPANTELPSKSEAKANRVRQIPEALTKLPKGLVQALHHMNAKLGFSFSDKTSRRDNTDIRFFYNSKWKDEGSEYRIDTEYRYSETDKEPSEDRYTANFRYRREQEKNFFIQASTFFRRDPIREVDLWLEQGIGVGWHNKVSANLEYSVGAEGSLKYEEFARTRNDIGGKEFLTTLFQDSVYHIGNSYQLVQEAETYIAPDNTANWGYRFVIKLDGKITSGISVQLGYEYSYENLVATNVPNKETLFSTSLLYTF